jgi:hypothetical protein
MGKSLLMGGLLGGIVVFAWSFISWTVLPWHTSQMLAFTNEAEVASVLSKNMTTAGIYYMPASPKNYASLSAEERKAADARMEEKLKAGPTMFGVVLPNEIMNMPKMMGVSLLFDILAALLITMLVMKTGDMTYAGRVSFIVTAALAVGIIAFVPFWIWFCYPTGWTLVMIADTLVGWLLAGLVIAKVAPRPAPRLA